MFEWFTFGKGVDWISKLWGKLWKIRNKYQKEIEEINNEILTDPLDIACYYIEPDCQKINPAGRTQRRIIRCQTTYHENDR